MSRRHLCAHAGRACRKRAVVWLRWRGDDRVLAVVADVSRRGRHERSSTGQSRHSVASMSWSTTSDWPGRQPARHDRRAVAGGLRSHADAGRPRLASGRAAHAASWRRVDRHHRVNLRARGRRPDDVQRGQSRRDQPREVAGAAARADEHPRQQRVAGVDPVRRWVLVEASAGRSRRRLPSSSSASCRSDDSDGPKRSAMSSPTSLRPAPAGSAAPQSSSTAVRAGRSACVRSVAARRELLSTRVLFLAQRAHRLHESGTRAGMSAANVATVRTMATTLAA